MVLIIIENYTLHLPEQFDLLHVTFKLWMK